MAGSRTEAVLVAALWAAAPTERAERRADLANMVSCSWRELWREEGGRLRLLAGVMMVLEVAGLETSSSTDGTSLD